jgi:hypothetical protein
MIAVLLTRECSAWLVGTVAIAIETTEAVVIRASSKSTAITATRIALAAWVLIFAVLCKSLANGVDMVSYSLTSKAAGTSLIEGADSHIVSVVEVALREVAIRCSKKASKLLVELARRVAVGTLKESWKQSVKRERVLR